MMPAVSPVLSRRLFCVSSLIAAAVPLPARAGQAWPQRTVRLVTRPPDGARNDAMARTLAAGLARRWRQPVTVDYRPGADSTAAVETFLAARDDHALLLCPAGVWTTPPLTHADPSFDPVRDLVPVAPVVQDFIALGVTPKSGFASLGEVIDAARRSPGKLAWASASPAPHLAVSAFLKAAGSRSHLRALSHSDGIAGRSRRGAGGPRLPAAAADHRRGGGRQIRLVAVASTDRAPAAPTVQTVGEAGFPSLAMFSGHSLFGLRDMPAARRAGIADDVATTLREPAVAERLTRLGYRPRLNSPTAFHALLQRERALGSQGGAARLRRYRSAMTVTG